jgi:hypothetical protein
MAASSNSGGRGWTKPVAGGVAAVGVLAGVVQILSWLGINPAASPAAPPPAASTAAVVAPSAAAPGGSTTTSPVTAAPAGQAAGCFLQGVETSCAKPHDTESVPGITCTADGLVAYLGGVQGVDVLHTSVALKQAPTGCQVTVPAGTASELKDALRGAGNDFRSCLDQGREVACGVRHSAEVVYVAKSATESPDCEARAGAFLGAPYGQYNDRLELVRGTVGDKPMCAVKLRDQSQALTSTLRNVRNRSFG